MNKSRFEGSLNIQWFPGHMAKARRILKENFKYVDLILEILDARAPISSQNPELLEIVKSKPKVILLSKTDLADKIASKGWVEYFRKKKFPTLAVNIKSNKGLEHFCFFVRKVLDKKKEEKVKILN